MKKIGFGRVAGVLAVCLAVSAGAWAQTYSVLALLGGNSGTYGPYQGSSLIQGTDGNFYGTSFAGAYSGGGTFFRVTPTGTLAVLYTFCAKNNCADGAAPVGTLVQGTDGNFYGATEFGGAVDNNLCSPISPGCGTVYKMTPGGKLTTLYSFCSQVSNEVCEDGAMPQAGLIQATDGNLYGTTCGYNCVGTVFKITMAGALTTLHSFSVTDGASPYSQLLQATNGNIYGTTSEGGTLQNGTVFEISTKGTFSSLYSFAGDGQDEGSFTAPNTLIQGANGYLYGTTFSGGKELEGTVFEMTLKGAATLLHTFCLAQGSGVCPDGASPRAGLALGTDGNFYGTTAAGGAIGTNGFADGTIFRITPTGTLTTLYNFCEQSDCADGSGPGTGLLQGTNGNFYGTTANGGNPTCSSSDAINCGVVYSLSMGLAPFVAPSPKFGTAGRVVRILGNGLTGTTSVTFNGTSAAFKVVSDTYLQAQVPAGATSGTIQVTTSSGTLNSNVAFVVP
jgi:uncharacterized repeat protein (TIGR03803 family)